MGAWGTAIYSDDIAMDIRDIYKEMLGDGDKVKYFSHN